MSEDELERFECDYCCYATNNLIKFSEHEFSEHPEIYGHKEVKNE